MVLIAIKTYPKSIKILSKDLLKEDFVIKCLKINYKCFEFISEKLLNVEMCLIAVKNGLNLKDIPKKFRNQKVCKKSVKYNEFSIDYVPDDVIDKEICENSVKEFPNSILIILKKKNGKKYLSEEVYKKARERNSFLKKVLPKSF
jgi:hypothetical protein